MEHGMEFIVDFDVINFNIDIIYLVQSNFVFVSLCSVIFVLSIATINFLLVKVRVIEPCISSKLKASCHNNFIFFCKIYRISSVEI